MSVKMSQVCLTTRLKSPSFSTCNYRMAGTSIRGIVGLDELKKHRCRIVGACQPG
ncbi:hypothetical protein HanIR_Chr09g0416631 [Helianthus annuus]|nr:hypothetical protein HanIR_Chr09g0416631 [Helianthus annuus]